jgi:hypothetical protein
MAKKGNLFFLIKSLSGSEKRYFRLQSQRGKAEAQYLQLFDFIDGQEEADEDAIKEHFKEEQFVKQLHVTKIYLTDLILRSLRNYHANSSVYSKVLDTLRDVEILFGKELYDQCHYKLLKAEKLADSYEKEALLLEVLGWKRKLLIAQSKAEMKEVAIISAQEKAGLQKLSDLNSYWDHTFNVFQNSGDKDYPKKLNIKKAGTLHARTLHHHVLYSWYFMNDRPASAEKEIAALIDHMEQYPARIEDDPGPYVTALSNKIALLLRQQRWPETEQIIQVMRAVPAQYKLSNENKFTLRLWLRIFNLELEMYRDTRQLAKAITLIKEMERYIEKHDTVIPDNYRLMLYYQAANIWFLKQDYAKCLYWINLILNYNFGDTRDDLQCHARILNLLVHFELDNIIVLRYSVDSTRRFFKKKKAEGLEEQAILRLFSRLSLSPSQNYKEVFANSYEELYRQGSERIEQMEDYLDLRGWIERRLKKRGH